MVLLVVLLKENKNYLKKKQKKKCVLTKNGKNSTPGAASGDSEPSRLGFGMKIREPASGGAGLRFEGERREKKAVPGTKKSGFSPQNGARGERGAGGGGNDIFRWFLNRFRGGVLGWGWPGAPLAPHLVAN